MLDETQNTLIKVCIIGSQNVGKTCVAIRFAEHNYGDVVNTIATNAFNGEIEFNDVKYTISITDTAGQESFRSLVPRIIRDQDFIIVAFDLTSNKSLTEITNEWAPFVLNNTTKPNMKLVLIGTKMDMCTEAEITKDSIESARKTLGAEIFFATSAKTDEGIIELFSYIAKTFAERGTTNRQDYFDIDPAMNPEKKKECC